MILHMMVCGISQFTKIRNFGLGAKPISETLKAHAESFSEDPALNLSLDEAMDSTLFYLDYDPETNETNFKFPGLSPASLSNPAWRPLNWLRVSANYVQEDMNDLNSCKAIMTVEPLGTFQNGAVNSSETRVYVENNFPCETFETEIITIYVGGGTSKVMDVYGSLQIKSLNWLGGTARPIETTTTNATTTIATTTIPTTSTTEEYEYDSFQINALSFSLNIAWIFLFFK